MELLARLPQLLALVTLVALVGRMETQEVAAEAARAELFTSVARRVEALAKWCQAERLYLERDRLYASLLELEPEHSDSRRFLRYRRTKTGWVRGTYRAPENRRAEALEGFHERREDLAQQWRDALRSHAERYRDELGEAANERFWDDLVILAPEDDEAREHRGEVRASAGEGWLLKESALGRLRRAYLQSRAMEIRAQEPTLEMSQPSDEESFLEWTEVLLVPAARILVAGEKHEAGEVARRSQAAVEVFRAVFDEAPILPTRLTICVLDGKARKTRFLERSPLVEPGQRALYSARDSFWVAKSTTLAIAGPSPEARVDETLGQLLERMIDESFGLGREQPWALEGLSLRLEELVTGGSSRSRHPCLRDEGKRGRKDEGLWTAARALLASDRRPGLAELVATPSDAFGREHLLLSYALACYLLEGHPERLVQTLDALGRSPGSSAAALEDCLGSDLAKLDARLERWAAEMGS